MRILLLSTSGAAQSVAQVKETAPDLTQPTLSGQPTRDTQGKLHFELFVNFGGVPDPAFYPPWRSSGSDGLFLPRNPGFNSRWNFLATRKSSRSVVSSNR